ncbi:MAG: ferritin [Alphaproteobacteria bacterium]|nr:ferritin [Alphaproteobacteria bacterium]
MGEMAKKIAKLDVEHLLETLNAAFAEEWLAYYQYWMGGKVAIGLQRTEVVREFFEHADEELKHAGWLADRIIQLGGTPLLNPAEWEEVAHCRYAEPQNFDVWALLQDNLEAERCAIGRYEAICGMTHGKDYETFRMAEKILKEEIEHEQELEDFTADAENARKFITKE